MSTITTRVCDRCKKEIAEKDWNQIWKVQILIAAEDTYNRSGYSIGQWLKENPYRKDWCRPCVDEMHLLNLAYTEKEKQALPQLTFEDQLREIIRDEIEGAQA